jgi:hypothetical protein
MGVLGGGVLRVVLLGGDGIFKRWGQILLGKLPFEKFKVVLLGPFGSFCKKVVTKGASMALPPTSSSRCDPYSHMHSAICCGALAKA